ncbi:RNA polymerase sigma factor, partial [Streptomyces lavendulae]|uniref:RNA polymerase sigma factor n=1 Tax=Streptomyces lavendulae TaxID=1914 RepID=UPI0036892483
PISEPPAAPRAPAVGAAALPGPSAEDTSGSGGFGITPEEAYEEFLEHQKFLRNYLRRHGADELMIDDVMSQAALRYATHRPKHDIGNVRAYLTMTAKYTWMDLLRARPRKTEIPIGDNWDLLPQETERSAEETVVENYLHEELLLKIRSLPARQREAVTLIYLQGMSYGEAAKKLGLSVPLLRKTHSRALQTLRELFGVRANPIET